MDQCVTMVIKKSNSSRLLWQQQKKKKKKWGVGFVRFFEFCVKFH